MKGALTTELPRQPQWSESNINQFPLISEVCVDVMPKPTNYNQTDLTVISPLLNLKSNSNSNNLIIAIPNHTLVHFVAYQVSLFEPEFIFCQDIVEPKYT